ncbi:MAG: HypC/HybG/HupF family hydrogenase formation chaperone [Acetobacter sp.]|nr:HypC/HybG/HupF family hydrogenase formation chaperone [Acetobacter sp.]MBQ5478942.1 HypC/HybG/HupF family hydrogenase formation chaperone [Acetobacter sp.]
MCLGIPGQIIAIVDKSAQLAEVDVLGVRRVIDVLCVLEEEQSITDLLGCWVLIHVGFAMSLIDENEARRTLEALERMGTLENETTALSLTAVPQGVTQTGSQ